MKAPRFVVPHSSGVLNIIHAQGIWGQLRWGCDQIAKVTLLAMLPTLAMAQGKWNDAIVTAPPTAPPATLTDRAGVPKNNAQRSTGKTESKRTGRTKSNNQSLRANPDLPAPMAPRSALRPDMVYVAVDADKVIQLAQVKPVELPKAYAPANALDKYLKVSRFRIIED